VFLQSVFKDFKDATACYMFSLNTVDIIIHNNSLLFNKQYTMYSNDRPVGAWFVRLETDVATCVSSS